MKQDSARLLAAKALMRCEKSGYSNLVLASMLQKSGLSARDRAFASRIVYGTVERQLTLDARLAPFLKQPLNTMMPELRAVLRSGLYQILYMDSVPTSAAVNEAVQLTRALGKGSASGFVNAVLRKASQAQWQPEAKTEEERLSQLYSVGLPVVKLLKAAYPDKIEALLQESFTQPKLTIRVNTLKTTAKELAALLSADGVKVSETGLLNALVLEDAGDITRLPQFTQGLFHVQGLASQLCVAALGVKPGDRVLDACAAPGGKTATIAQTLCGQGSLTACELHPARVKLIETLIARIGAQNVTARAQDAAVFDPAIGEMDKVLCDVPCSGLGTLAKKPDIRYKDLQDLPKLIKIQGAILATAAQYLVPGGSLVYSTCTINPKENELVVQEFLRTHPEFTATDTGIAGFGEQKLGAFCLFFPQGGQDGFFIARLTRAEKSAPASFK